MFQLKPLSKDALPAALEKAMRYRLLNEPSEAESICLDVLIAEPDNQQALTILVLALTDRFNRGYAVGEDRAHEIVARFRSPYDQAYYSGIIAERRAKAFLNQGVGGSDSSAFEKFQEAMRWYEQAEKIRPPGNDDALLRWNTCARIIMRNKLSARVEDEGEPPLE